MKIDDKCSHHAFLMAAASASWFNDYFDYRTVSKWCGVTEAIGKLMVDALTKSGHVQASIKGFTSLTETGKSEARKAA